MSYEEWKYNQVETFNHRVIPFLGELLGGNPDKARIIEPVAPTNTREEYRNKIYQMPCGLQARLAKAFEEQNERLYEVLKGHHTSVRRPAAEQHPFPRFKLDPCIGDDDKELMKQIAEPP